MGGWNLLSGLMPPAVDTAGESERRHSRDSGAEEEFEILEQEEIKEHRHSEDSGNCSEAEEGQDTNRVLEFQLTQSLLSQVKAGENNRNANSGKQAQLDLERMDFVINGQTISKEYVCELYYQHNHLILNENYRTFAKQVFTEMFKHAKAEIPNDNVLEELITNCNQAGYEFAVYGHIHPILDQYGLIPTIPQKTVSLCCNSAGCIDVEYSDVIVVKNPDQLRQYEAFSKLEFTLKSRGDRAEYENGKVTLTIPKELENYKADGKSLLDDINRHFVDVGNTIIESLVENIDEGPKSLPSETQTSNQAVSREQLNNKESKNQQLRENVIDKGENIINSEKASKEAIGNNYRRGKMPKDIKTIGKKLSDAIFDLNYEEVRSLVEQVKEENNSVDAKQILNKALEDANKTEVGKKDKVSQSKLAEIKIFLEKELEHIATALPVSGDVGATASSQEVPVVERKESEPDSPSLSFEDDDFSKLEGDGSARISSDSPSFDMIDDETETPKTAAAMPSMVTEEKLGNINDKEDDNYVSISSGQGQDAQSEVLASELEIENINNDITVNQSAGHVEQMANEDTQSEPVVAAGIVSRIESDSPSLSSEDDKLESDDSARISSDSPSFEVIDEAEASISTAPEMAKFEVAASTPKMPSIVTKEKVSNIKEDDNDVSASSDKGQDEQLKLVIPIADEQGSKNNQKTTVPQNTKKYIVAAAAIAITGIALGVAVAVYLEMLAIGVAVAACCLIAATITYCYRPKSLVEDNEVKKVDDTQKSTPCCG